MRLLPGSMLVCADFAAIESRGAGVAGRRDSGSSTPTGNSTATGNKQLELYRVIAARMLNKDIDAISSAERQKGKAADLACGFGGSVGAWRRIVADDPRTDAEIKADHPAVARRASGRPRKLWARAGASDPRRDPHRQQPILVAPAPRPPIVAAFDGDTLTLTLPSGRAIIIREARLVPNAKFEGGDPDVEFIDNAKANGSACARGSAPSSRTWCREPHAICSLPPSLRAEARGWPVVFHCHDEIVDRGAGGHASRAEVLAMLLEPPAWAVGLPLDGKVHRGPTYLEAPATGEPPEPQTEQEIVEHAVDAFVATPPPQPGTMAVERSADEDFLASLGHTSRRSTTSSPCR